jgi:hypothetical protein
MRKNNFLLLPCLFIVFSGMFFLILCCLFKPNTEIIIPKKNLVEVAPMPRLVKPENKVDIFWKDLYEQAKKKNVPIFAWVSNIRSKKPISIRVYLKNNGQEIFVGEIKSENCCEKELKIDFATALRELKTPPSHTTELVVVHDETLEYTEIGVDIYPEITK